jgi:hypothetical protein
VSQHRRELSSAAAAIATINTTPIVTARSPLIDHHGNSTTYVAVLWCLTGQQMITSCEHATGASLAEHYS